MRPLPRRLLIMALALVALFVVIRAPLGLLTRWLPKTIALKDVEGSLWAGRAAAIGVGGTIVQQQVEWNFQPQALLSAHLAWAVSGRFGDQRSRLNLALRASGAELSELSVHLPLAPLAALHPKLKPLQLSALLHVSASRLSARTASKATIDVAGLFCALVASSAPFGPYRIEVDAAADGHGRWTLSSSPGPLGASGQGQFDVNRAQLGGQLLLTPSAPIPGLALLPRAGDAYLITL